MYMKDGLYLSGKGAAVFADKLSAAVDSDLGTMTNIFGSKHSLNQKCRGGTQRCLKQNKRPLAQINQYQIIRKTSLKKVIDAYV